MMNQIVRIVVNHKINDIHRNRFCVPEFFLSFLDLLPVQLHKLMGCTQNVLERIFLVENAGNLLY